jgi:hypothetical protein
VYVRSTTSTGASAADWSDPVYISPPDQINWWSRHAGVISGNPAIFYGADWTSGLTFCRSTSSTGESPLDWSKSCQISAVDLGSYTDLESVGGHPAYVNPQMSGGLYYCRATSADGGNPSDWGQSELVASGNISYSSLAEVEGKPAIAFRKEEAGLMYLIYAYFDG